ncbi:mucin TcMUCII, partial [Trypanosoma cruzi]
MMMTCRLLCALLVLALCCCPYVCAAGTNLDQDSGSNGNIAGLPSHAPATNSAPEAPGISNKNATPGDPADAGPSPSRREAVSQATTPSGLPRNGLGAEPGKVGGMGSESKVTIDVLKAEDSGDRAGTEIDTNTSADQKDKSARDAAKTTTTTTTTKAPTTTTT